MKYKTGDIAWFKRAGCKCVIEEVHETFPSTYYHISYVREINKGKLDRSGVVTYTKVTPEDLADYLTHCPICGKNVRVLSGLVDNHPKDGPLCYGSYLPQK